MHPPYYIVPDVEEYKKLDPHSDEAKKLARKIAANVGDLAALRLILGIDPPEFARYYPDMENSTPSTMDTIDSFLDKFGTAVKTPDFNNTLGLAYSLDNIGMEEQDYQPVDKEPEEEDILTGETPENEERQEDEDFKTLMKQGRYHEALMLIEGQNLNNTEKSIYFAHQIRFLKKLIALENYKNLTKG